MDNKKGLMHEMEYYDRKAANKIAGEIVKEACNDYMNAKEWFYSPRGRMLLQGIDPDTVIKVLDRILDRRVELGLDDKVMDSVNDELDFIIACIELGKTPIEDRKDKRFIIPLPGLVTTDGEQQYLTKNGSFFASRRDKRLRQTWKAEHLKFVPEIYRKYAVELEEEDDF